MSNEEMNCEQVRERVENPEIVVEREISKAHQFIRHTMTCQNCKKTLSAEQRGRAIHAVVMAITD